MAEWNKLEAQRQNAKEANENAAWNNMVKMLGAVNNTSADTLAGYGLGKMLKRWIGTAWDDYMRGQGNSTDLDNSAYGKEAKQVLQTGLMPGITGQTSSEVPAVLVDGSAQIPGLSLEEYYGQPLGIFGYSDPLTYSEGVGVVELPSDKLPQKGQG